MLFRSIVRGELSCTPFVASAVPIPHVRLPITNKRLFKKIDNSKDSLTRGTYNESGFV